MVRESVVGVVGGGTWVMGSTWGRRAIQSVIGAQSPARFDKGIDGLLGMDHQG